MGGPGNQVHPFVHQRAVPDGSAGFCVGGVFHDDPNLAVVVLCCPDSGGYQAQYHHQCQQQRNDAFLHMHFPPVKYLCPAVSGKSTKCAPGHSHKRAHFRRKNRRSPPRDHRRRMLSPAHNEENARRAFVLRRAILLPRAVEPMAPRLHPTFSGDCPQWRTFVPAAKAASVHSCAHSAVRVGFPTPFLLGRHLAVFRPLRYPPHSILGHDSLSGPVSPQSHSYHTRFPRKSQRSAPCKTALYCRTAKNRRSGAESPCFAGKKDV